MSKFITGKLALIVAVLALIVSVFSFFHFKSSSQLVYVDVNKLLDGYKRTELVKAEFETKAKTLNGNVDSLLTDWQKELAAYEKDKSTMTEKELELKKELLSNKQQQINNYQRAVQEQIQKGDQESLQTVINDINAYVKEYGETHHYDIIFGASGTGNIMYASEATDLTQEVLIGLNEEFKGK